MTNAAARHPKRAAHELREGNEDGMTVDPALWKPEIKNGTAMPGVL